MPSRYSQYPLRIPQVPPNPRSMPAGTMRPVRACADVLRGNRGFSRRAGFTRAVATAPGKFSMTTTGKNWMAPHRRRESGLVQSPPAVLPGGGCDGLAK